MRLEHHLVGGYVRYISPHIIIIIIIIRVYRPKRFPAGQKVYVVVYVEFVHFVLLYITSKHFKF